MYLKFYNLKREPFHITPDPNFLYLSPSHKEALAAILYGVKQRKGFIVITGEVGVGKTTVLRSYIEGVEDKNLKIVYVFDANVSFSGLLKLVFRELGLAEEGKDDLFDKVSRLHCFLIEEYRKNNNVVVIIDEAQNMPVETLESLRMLSNLETSTDKLIQIILVGPPELDKKLNLHELRQVKQRIAVRASISSLDPKESIAYVQHRLKRAGGQNEAPFSRRALKKITEGSRGIPRVTNILCDNALISGFGYQKKKIGSRIIRDVISDLEKTDGSPSTMKWRLATLLILLVAAILLWFWMSPYREPILSKI